MGLEIIRLRDKRQGAEILETKMETKEYQSLLSPTKLRHINHLKRQEQRQLVESHANQTISNLIRMRLQQI
jgi:hypothetical protein